MPTRLASEGARLAIADVDLSAAEGVANSLPGTEGTHVAQAIDITNASSVDHAIAQTAAAFGKIDVLVNVAGGDTEHGTFTEIGDDIWLKMVELNLIGVARCCRAAIPYLRQSTHHPCIVNVASINALTALGSEPYSAAKAGVVSLTANLAATLAIDRIRVNGVAPATIRTRVWDGQPGGADRLRHLYPLGRIGEPVDVAAAVAFLASSDAAWITGHTLPVDGGLLTGFPLR